MTIEIRDWEQLDHEICDWANIKPITTFAIGSNSIGNQLIVRNDDGISTNQALRMKISYLLALLRSLLDQESWVKEIIFLT